MLIECNSDEPDEWTIVGLHGALDFNRAGSIRKLLLDNVRSHGCVLADFSAVTRIDSAGIACIIEAYRAATKNGGRFELAGANQQVMRMLKLNRLDKVLSIHESEANKSKPVGELLAQLLSLFSPQGALQRGHPNHRHPAPPWRHTN